MKYLSNIFQENKDYYIIGRYPFVSPSSPRPNINSKDYIHRINYLIETFKTIHPENLINGTPDPDSFFSNDSNNYHSSYCIGVGILSFIYLISK